MLSQTSVRPVERLLGWRGPWVRYQLGATGGMFADFDATGSLLSTDFQFGGRLDVLWTGPFDEARGITSFDRPVVTCNAAAYWQALRETGIDDRLDGFGRLFATH